MKQAETEILEYFNSVRHDVTLKVTPRGDYNLILDTGCGIGAFIRLLENLFHKSLIVGLDLSLGKLKQAKVLVPRNYFVLADVRYLPFKSKSANLIYCLEIIEHIREEKMFISELKRVLRDDGIVVLSTPNNSSLRSITGRVICAFRRKKWTAYNVTHVKVYTPFELKRVLNPNFEIVDRFGFWFIPSGLNYLFGAKLRKYIICGKIASFVSKNQIGVQLGFITIAIMKKMATKRK